PADSFNSVIITTVPTPGSLELSSVAVTAGQEVLVSDLANLIYSPVADANGTSYSSFTFQVKDDGGTSNGGVDTDQSANTIIFDVTAVNDEPTASDNTITTNEDTPYTFSASDFNFSDVDGDSLASVQITSLETVGDLKLNGTDVTLNQVIAVADITNGLLVFSSVLNANGASYDSFNFSVNDGTVDSLSSYTMTVDVTAVNDEPSASDNTITTNEDTPYTFSASDFNFTDVDGDSLASVQITSLETVGDLKLNGTDVTLNQVIAVADITNGLLVFSSVLNANGSGYDSFNFSVNDGTADSLSSYTMTVDVTAVNDEPTASDNTITTNEDTPYTFSTSDFNYSDVEGDAFTSVEITSLETVGDLELSGAAVTLNQVIAVADITNGLLVFSSVLNANGASYDSFNFSVNDGTTDSLSSYTMTVDVTAVNDAPELYFNLPDQLGSDIDGEAASDHSGKAVSFNEDGSIVAIGASFNDGNGADSGHVRVYQWNGTIWNQLGSDIDGEATGVQAGRIVQLSYDGLTLIVGSLTEAEIYDYNGTNWIQRGSDITGGHSLRGMALSGDG
ncbi:Ig-like domain-containing protein, partial [Thiotrichales bacterium 19S11-10]|nr:Ig-like domain-containing protein [Thiotrichales bacterium 19S11-10]